MNQIEWNLLSNQEQELNILMEQFEREYFEDMILKTLCEVNSDVFDPYEFGIGVLNDESFSAHTDDMNECAGLYRPEDNTIVISEGYSGDKKVILHEMIHYYDYKLSLLWSCYYEWVLLSLKEKLSTIIPDLDDRINAHIEYLHFYKEQNEVGNHSILFFLKSYDLDIRCGYELGTICSYNRTDFNK